MTAGPTLGYHDQVEANRRPFPAIRIASSHRTPSLTAWSPERLTTAITGSQVYARDWDASKAKMFFPAPRAFARSHVAAAEVPRGVPNRAKLRECK
jgi:hypothetical protein